jgi:hypothetical protein
VLRSRSGIRHALPPAGISFSGIRSSFIGVNRRNVSADAKDVIHHSVNRVVSHVSCSGIQLARIALGKQSISLIAKNDDHDHCTSLLPNLARRLQSQPSDIAMHFFEWFAQDTNSIFKAFRHLEPTHHLLHAAGNSGTHQFALYQYKRGAQGARRITLIRLFMTKLAWKVCALICRIFYSLNYQDLPEKL